MASTSLESNDDDAHMFSLALGFAVQKSRILLQRCLFSRPKTLESLKKLLKSTTSSNFYVVHPVQLADALLATSASGFMPELSEALKQRLLEPSHNIFLQI